jgi:hypothetical protein
MIPIINYNGQEVVFAGDFIPTAANVPVKWLASYDLNPTASLAEKQNFLSEAVKNKAILFLQHDITTECCSLIETEKGVRVYKCFSLSEI